MKPEAMPDSSPKTMKATAGEPTPAQAALLDELKEGGLCDTAATLDALYHAAETLDYWRIAVPCAGAGSRNALLTKLADTLQFPDHFGMNLDALYDCITDQLLANKKKGAVLILQGAKKLPPEALSPVVDTLLDAAEFMQTKGQRLVIVLQ